MGYLSIFTILALVTTPAWSHSVVFIPAGAEHQFEQLVRPLNDSPANKCDYHCARVFEPICATNGHCLERFPSACTMSAYNCEHPQRPFFVIDDWKCEQKWAPVC